MENVLNSDHVFSLGSAMPRAAKTIAPSLSAVRLATLKTAGKICITCTMAGDRAFAQHYLLHANTLSPCRILQSAALHCCKGSGENGLAS